MAAYQRTLSVQELISRVMGSYGLPVPTNAFSSSDGNVIQMLTLLNDVGQELIGEHEWNFLSSEQDITTDGTTTEFSLPPNFDRYISDSAWNYSTRLPMIGSINEQAWQMLKARNLGGMTIAMLFRVVDDQLQLYEPSTSGQTLKLPYVTRSWVQVGSEYADNVSQNSDVIRYPAELIRAALELRWMEKKGFDTAKAKKRYDDALQAAKTKDVPAQTISLVPGVGAPLLGQWNIPDTQYGTS